MNVLGIEGTAWNASAAVFDSDAEEIVSHVSEPYVPDEGGIHPREASEHISSSVVDVVGDALEDAGIEDGDEEVDAVAFSRGPGLGPCLRNVGTAARALSIRFDADLVGVNHTVAHIEMGRFLSGFDDPVVLDSAGANTLVTTYRGGRYRVLGETLDTGVGNSLDKFARHAGLSHPGGPKLEELASESGKEEYVELPYTVKGMDFSFSGIVSAAKERYDDGIDVERLAYSLQENVFGMLTEVSERALSLTRKDELVVGGGVSCNARLREMLREMCNERGAEFYAPEPEYLSDNGAMIAVTGWMMYTTGQTVEVKESKVMPDWRPDEVEVEWRENERVSGSNVDLPPESPDETKGAEATVGFGEERVRKRRLPKSYRCKPLDELLRRRRTKVEARLFSEGRRAGVPTPTVLDVDTGDYVLSLELLRGDGESEDRGEGRVAPDVTSDFSDEDAEVVGSHLSELHSAGIVHGDPTTRNVVRSEGSLYLVDFGLAYNSRDVEDFGMDVHVFKRTVDGVVDSPDEVMEGFWSGYSWEKSDEVRHRLRKIEGRGRYL